MTAYLFLDTETTGLDPVTDEITEVAWILDYDGKPEGRSRRAESLITHTVKADDWRRRNTDYAQRHAEGVERDLIKVLTVLQKQCREADDRPYLVGANPAFDQMFMIRHFGRMPYHFFLIDINVMAMNAFGLAQPPPMKEISALLGIPRSNDAPHTAMSDVMETRDLFYRLRALK